MFRHLDTPTASGIQLWRLWASATSDGCFSLQTVAKSSSAHLWPWLSIHKWHVFWDMFTAKDGRVGLHLAIDECKKC